MKLRTHTNKKAANEKDDCDNGKGGADGKAARNVNTDKKKANSRKYAGKKKKHAWPNFSPSGRGNVRFGSGGNIGGQHTGLSGSKAQPGSRQDKSGSSHTKDFEPIIEEVDSEEEKEYVYESEAFVSPISSDDKGGNKHQCPEHKTGYGYGEVYFELGMEFDTMAEFKECLKDYFVYEGKECPYIHVYYAIISYIKFIYSVIMVFDLLKLYIGLPCKHAVAAIFRLKKMGYKLEDFVDKSLTVDAV
ncbi:uncharacterized protein LOC110266806 [Arachis ipaensis]|uniref:uncharacterized protein LOC110266806 n=1 Tax=Arachis ipaensis TaxID=130454 RepID=UPI000A2B9171|nr:uncharacterized protein LOC110266806 [Arachis ipaensis]